MGEEGLSTIAEDIEVFLAKGGIIKQCTSADNAETAYKISKTRKECIEDQKRRGTLSIANAKDRLKGG